MSQNTTQVGELRPGTGTVVPYDFLRPTTLIREHGRQLDSALETFARQWSTKLKARLNAPARVQVVGSVHMATYEEYVLSLPASTTMILCGQPEAEDEAPAARSVLQVQAPTALSWVGRMLGGNGSVPAPDRKFTPVEDQLVTVLIDEALQELHFSFGTLSDGQMQVRSIHHNASVAQAAPPGERMIVASLDVVVAQDTARMTFATPADALIEKLGGSKPVAAGDTTARVREQIHQTPVRVVAQFKPTTITAAHALSLQVDDVVRLPHPANQPLDVVLGGRILAAGVSGEDGNKLAVQIIHLNQENS